MTAIFDIANFSYLLLLYDSHTQGLNKQTANIRRLRSFLYRSFGMMDPLSMTASIVAVPQLTTTLTSYIHSVRHATAEKAKVAVEASNLCSLLNSLRYRVEAIRSDDSWFNQVRMLGIYNGPLDQLKDILKKMVEQISSSRRRDQIRSALTWKFNKSEVENALERMERLKSLINCALSGDLL